MKHLMTFLAPRRIVSLRRHEIARLQGAGQLCVTRGAFWLTLHGQLDDHFLRQGDRFTLGRGADAVLQAIDGPASVVMAKAAPMPWRRLAAQALQIATRRLARIAS